MASTTRTILSSIPAPFKRKVIGIDPLLKETDDRFTPVRVDNLKIRTNIKEGILKNRTSNNTFSVDRSKKLAVIIPYRNRAQHLATLIPVLTEQLSSQKLNFRIVVAEQADEERFNRGKTINVGALAEWDWADYFCIHDVDNIPVNAEYGCPSEPLRLVSLWESTWRTYDIQQLTYFSGVISMKKEVFSAANGFNNEYWGWGLEDDDFLIRCLLAGSIPHQDRQGVFTDLNNPAAETAATNSWVRHSNKRWLRWQMLRKNFNAVGLSNIRYSITDDQECAYYRKVSYRN